MIQLAAHAVGCSFPRAWIFAPLLFLLSVLTAQAQAPAWQQLATAANVPGSSSFGRATATDASGNVYITGEFTGTVNFGNTALSTAGPVGDYDVFVAKWSPATNGFVWALQAGGTLQEGVQALAISGSSIYMGGFFDSATASFGSATLTNAGPASATGSQDLFVAKLTDSGPTASFTWAQRAGSADWDALNSLVVSGPNVYLAGETAGGARFGSIVLPGTGSLSMYVAKLNDAGPSSSFVWAQQAGNASGTVTATALAINGNDLYVSGYFYGVSASMGSTTLLNADTNGYTSDAFVAKLTDVGASSRFAWATPLGGASFDRPLALAANGPNLYVTGYYGQGPTTLGTTLLPNPTSSYDVFVARLTDLGSSNRIEWAQRAGGAGDDIPYALAVRGTNVYILGGFRGSSASFGATTLTNLGFVNIFLAKLIDAGTTGQFSWAQSANGRGATAGVALSLSGASLYVAGTTSPPSGFGGLSTPGPAGASTAYWAMLTDPTLLSSAPAVATARIGIYPNPAHTMATVVVPVMPGVVRVSFTLLDFVGRVVRSTTAALPAGGLSHSLNLAGLPAGLYALRVQGGNTVTGCTLAIE